MDAFDADVLIFAAVPEHPLGRRVAVLLDDDGREPPAGIGSVLLLPEVLSRPRREGSEHELDALTWLLARLDLRPVDHAVAALSVVLASEHRLRAADAVHLATAVNAGADRFITNNSRDFRRDITEIDVTYPGDLDDPTGSHA